MAFKTNEKMKIVHKMMWQYISLMGGKGAALQNTVQGLWGGSVG